MVKPFKIKVESKSHSREIQEYLFEHKVPWYSSGYEVGHTDKPFLFVYPDYGGWKPNITYTIYRDSFNDSQLPEKWFYDNKLQDKPNEELIMKEINTDREVLQAILDGYEVEVLYPTTGEWKDLKAIHISINLLDKKVKGHYRLKPTKPSIDWSHVSDEFNYLARDKEGLVYLYGSKPKITEYDWWFVDDVEFVSASAFKSVEIGNCDWTESLVERPDNVENKS